MVCNAAQIPNNPPLPTDHLVSSDMSNSPSDTVRLLRLDSFFNLTSNTPPVATPTAITFKSDPLSFFIPRVYGGQLLAQSIMSALQYLHSLGISNRIVDTIECTFIHPGLISQSTDFIPVLQSDPLALHYAVTPLKDGRSFSLLSVKVFQNNELLCESTLTFQISNQPGKSVNKPLSYNYLPWQQCVALETLPSPLQNYYLHEEFFEIRLSAQSIEYITRLGNSSELSSNNSPVSSTGEDSQFSYCWVHLKKDVMNYLSTHKDASFSQDAQQTFYRALSAYGADQLIMLNALTALEFNFLSSDISFTTMNNSMWWYDDLDLEDWILLTFEMPVGAHSRYWEKTSLYQNGELKSLIAQDLLIRSREA